MERIQLGENEGQKLILVLGMGNILLGDEGFGVHVARRLKQMDLPASVKVEEGGVGGFNLLGQLDGIQKLLIVDVMMFDAPPGEISIIKPGQKLSEPGKQIVSFHQVGVLELIELGKLIGFEPEVTFIVTRPEKMEWCTELSPALQCAVDKAAGLIQELCAEMTELKGGRNYAYG